MKVIDLLNKIAKNEEIPKKIKYEGDIWKLNALETTYDNGECCLFEDYIDKKYVITDVLNDEIEIIEEEKKIPEKLEETSNIGDLTITYPSNKELMDKINEIIDYIKSKEK